MFGVREDLFGVVWCAASVHGCLTVAEPSDLALYLDFEAGRSMKRQAWSAAAEGIKDPVLPGRNMRCPQTGSQCAPDIDAETGSFALLTKMPHRNIGNAVLESAHPHLSRQPHIPRQSSANRFSAECFPLDSESWT